MKHRLQLWILSALALALSILGWVGYREIRLRFAQWKYSRELRPGMERQTIENRFLAEGIRFFPESPNVDFVSVGDEMRYSLACAPREAGLLLEFTAPYRTSSGAQVLQSVKAVRHDRGCM